MKKLILSIGVAFIGFTSMAQEQMTSEETKAIKLIELTSGQQFDIMTEPIVKMVAEDKREEFKKELSASTEELYKKMAVIYTEKFTEEELDEILAFYATPVGEKMVELTPDITKKAMEIGQAWGMELQPMMAKYMQ
ncbi:DUF2059 domain-containing protein [Christiangramia sp. ASW11-125]|uniref:DUF2059 domain-containing protein n=1 Tax=Christiangramia sp. ASW11-125 TaxID=3400701 RepID=UPI003AB0BBE6